MDSVLWLARTPGKKVISLSSETYVGALQIAAERLGVSLGDVEVRIVRDGDLERAAKKVEAGT